MTTPAPRRMRSWKQGINRSWKNEKNRDPEAVRSWNWHSSPSDGYTAISPELRRHVPEEDWFNPAALRKEKRFLIAHYTHP
jgi:hypothetical protein